MNRHLSDFLTIIALSGAVIIVVIYTVTPNFKTGVRHSRSESAIVDVVEQNYDVPHKFFSDDHKKKRKKKRPRSAADERKLLQNEKAEQLKQKLEEKINLLLKKSEVSISQIWGDWKKKKRNGEGYNEDDQKPRHKTPQYKNSVRIDIKPSQVLDQIEKEAQEIANRLMTTSTSKAPRPTRRMRTRPPRRTTTKTTATTTRTTAKKHMKIFQIPSKGELKKARNQRLKELITTTSTTTTTTTTQPPSTTPSLEDILLDECGNEDASYVPVDCTPSHVTLVGYHNTGAAWTEYLLHRVSIQYVTGNSDWETTLCKSEAPVPIIPVFDDLQVRGSYYEVFNGTEDSLKSEEIIHRSDQEDSRIFDRINEILDEIDRGVIDEADVDLVDIQSFMEEQAKEVEEAEEAVLENAQVEEEDAQELKEDKGADHFYFISKDYVQNQTEESSTTPSDEPSVNPYIVVAQPGDVFNNIYDVNEDEAEKSELPVEDSEVPLEDIEPPLEDIDPLLEESEPPLDESYVPLEEVDETDDLETNVTDDELKDILVDEIIAEIETQAEDLEIGTVQDEQEDETVDTEGLDDEELLEEIEALTVEDQTDAEELEALLDEKLDEITQQSTQTTAQPLPSTRNSQETKDKMFDKIEIISQQVHDEFSESLTEQQMALIVEERFKDMMLGDSYQEDPLHIRKKREVIGKYRAEEEVLADNQQLVYAPIQIESPHGSRKFSSRYHLQEQTLPNKVLLLQIRSPFEVIIHRQATLVAQQEDNSGEESIHLRGYMWARHVKYISSSWYDHTKSWLCSGAQNIRIVKFEDIMFENFETGTYNVYVVMLFLRCNNFLSKSFFFMSHRAEAHYEVLEAAIK